MVINWRNCLGFFCSSRNTKGQMKIMQMSFMILGVFFFFILVGLFFLSISLSGIRSDAEGLARAQAISSLEIIASMPELNYNSVDFVSVDEDKLIIMASGFGNNYEKFWPIASLEFYKVHPAFEKKIECPASNCNHYEIYDSGQKNIEKISSYISICKTVRELGSDGDRCEVGKIVVGVKKNDIEE